MSHHQLQLRWLLYRVRLQLPWLLYWVQLQLRPVWLQFCKVQRLIQMLMWSQIMQYTHLFRNHHLHILIYQPFHLCHHIPIQHLFHLCHPILIYQLIHLCHHILIHQLFHLCYHILIYLQANPSVRQLHIYTSLSITPHIVFQSNHQRKYI